MMGGNIGALSHVEMTGGCGVDDQSECELVVFLGSLVPASLFTSVLLVTIDSVFEPVEMENLAGGLVVVLLGTGQVQEQLQQSIFGRGDLNTGQPGYQFWKKSGSPLAHPVQGVSLLLVPL